MDNPTPLMGNSSPPIAAILIPPAPSLYGYVATLDQSQEVAIDTATKQISETLIGIIGKLK